MSRTIFTTAMMLLSVTPLLAAEATVKVEHPFARPSLGAGRNSAAFMALVNTADRPDALIKAESDVATRVGLHTHRRKTIDGQMVMQMRPVKQMDIPARGRTVLQPGGLHIMLFGVKKPLKPGDSFTLRLTFQRAAPLTITVPVTKISTKMKRMQKMH
ncbi:MAG TPA: copper chaperone PCu(A)C [Thermopetrobacter sp.]|nr:copper chaperone PCu(A)C [Thermopetrobacter sp.]